MESKAASALFCLFVLCSLCFTEAKAREYLFHPPETQAEKSLAGILKHDAQEGKLKEYLLNSAVKREMPDWWLTQGLDHAVGSHVFPTCAAKDIEGKPCKDHEPLPSCNWYGLEDGLLFHTVQSSGKEAIVTYANADDLESFRYADKPYFRMQKSKGVWRIDGIDCGFGYTFNMLEEDILRYCNKIEASQTGMTMCAARAVKGERNRLDALIQTLENGYADHPERLVLLNEAQRSWEEFIKAQLALLYFDTAGSVVPMCRSNEVSFLINQRYLQLKGWVDAGVERENVCGGL